MVKSSKICKFATPLILILQNKDSCSAAPGMCIAIITRYWSKFLVACHMTKPIHNPLRSLMKTQRLGRNVTKKLYGESSNWFTIYLYLTQLDDWEHSQVYMAIQEMRRR